MLLEHCQRLWPGEVIVPSCAFYEPCYFDIFGLKFNCVRSSKVHSKKLKILYKVSKCPSLLGIAEALISRGWH
jgi:hypothetical protein